MSEGSERRSWRTSVATAAAGSASLALAAGVIAPADGARAADSSLAQPAAPSAEPCAPSGPQQAPADEDEACRPPEDVEDPSEAPPAEPEPPAEPPAKPVPPGEPEPEDSAGEAREDRPRPNDKGKGGKGKGGKDKGRRGGDRTKPGTDRRRRRGGGDGSTRGGESAQGPAAGAGGSAAAGPPPAGPGHGWGVVTAGPSIPPFLVPIYERCGRRYGIPWQVLAAINQVETAFGSNLNVSSAGAIGWMQFLPSSWRAYGVDANGDGKRDPYDPEDAICSAANYLRAHGGRDDLRRAIFAYNRADWYVEMVLSLARSYAGIEVGDPLPRAKRLDRGFARELARVARRHEVDWAEVLAVLRADGETGRKPATAEKLAAIARRIAGSSERAGLSRLRPRQTASGLVASEEVSVLARYNRAIGLRGLVEGLYAVRDDLKRRVLESDSLSVYPGGREDIKAGRIDPRVLTLLLYLAESHDELTVTSLISGHGYYARPGVPSAHVFGRAVDIAAIDGVPLLGNQQAGGVAERTVREILMLPDELQPSQLISLFELGGPSFAAADHHDHIHVGF